MEKEIKEPINTKITSVIEVTYEVTGNQFIPKREVKEYWTLDGRKIGQFDLLDELSFIKDWPSRAIYSADSRCATERK